MEENVDINMIRRYVDSDCWLSVQLVHNQRQKLPCFCGICKKDVDDSQSIFCNSCLEWVSEVSSKYRKIEDRQEKEEVYSTSEESAGESENVPTAYEQLVSSVTGQEEFDVSDESEDDEDSVNDESKEVSDSVIEEEEIDGDSDDCSENNESIASNDLSEECCNSDNENDSLSTKDEFSKHFEHTIEDSLAERVNNRKDWVTSEVKVPCFGKCVYTAVEQKVNVLKELNIKKLAVKQSLINQIAVTNKRYTNASISGKDILTSFQSSLFAVLNSYQDFYYPERSFSNAEDIRLVYCIHALNHVLKTRSRVMAHNSKLKNSAEDPTEDYRDQGLTRPKVLVVLPFRETAKRVVNMLQLLLMPEDQSFVTHKKRFMSEYSSLEEVEKKGFKPDDFEELFSGNVDDHFRIGIGVAKKSLKLYSDFYSADIILASPLGLRTIIGAEGDKDRDFDFLSSIELLILDQADVFLMQNWDHILHLMNHLHVQPKEGHGVDFSRVRMWSLNGWSKYYRQTVVFSDITRPDLNALFNKYCLNWAGKLTVPKSLCRGSICQIVTQLPQVFKKCDASSFSEASDKRFEFFKAKILSQVQDKEIKGKLIYISSYFDFVRLRNFLKKEEIDFVHINEYAKDKNIDRARGLFYHEKVSCMLYTERFHFYRRIKLRGIKNLIFYELPNYPQFYSELCNMMKDPKKDNSSRDNWTCTVIYNKYDAQKLPGIVGTERASHMITSEKLVQMFVTGES